MRGCGAVRCGAVAVCMHYGGLRSAAEHQREEEEGNLECQIRVSSMTPRNGIAA
jgi:hypothetical protein